MANTYTLISSATVGSGGASSIEFTNIPQTFTDLILKVSGRSSSNDSSFYLRFNGSTTGYSKQDVLTYVDSPTSGTAASWGESNVSAISLSALSVSNFTASTFNSTDIYIPNYTSSNNKSLSADIVTENNAVQNLLWLLGGIWTNSAAITQITLTPVNGATFVIHSTAYLYGISKV